MTRERYIPSDNQWLSYPEADWEQFVADVESQAGGTVLMAVQPTGEVIIQFNDLPPGVSETDAKNAVKDNHPHR